MRRNAGVKKNILGEAYYEVKVGDFELRVVPLTYSDDDWEYTGDGGVRIQMGKDGRDEYALLNKNQFALLMKELKNAEALVHEVHSASSEEPPLPARRLSALASERSSLIRLASSLPNGSAERKVILSAITEGQFED